MFLNNVENEELFSSAKCEIKMIVQSKHWGKTIRGWTEEMGDTRQSSWIKQGGMWITKWERIILEI